MSRYWMLLLTFTVLATTACSDDSPTAPVPVDRPSSTAVADSLAIRATIQRLEAAWASMDAPAYAREFAIDAQFVNILGQNMNGQPEIFARHQFLFTGPFRGSRLQNTILRLRFLHVLQKVNGAWVVSSGTNTAVAPS